MESTQKIEVRNYKSSSEFADEKLKRRKHGKWHQLADIINAPLWMPSIASGTKGIAIVLMIVLILKIGVWYGQDLVEKYNILIIRNSTPVHQTLVAVNTGVGAVLIGLAFFVAQSFLDKSDTDKARVLLKTSSFFALLMAEVGTFIILLTGDINILGFVLVEAVGIFTIIFVGRTVKILISTTDIEKAKVKMFTDLLKSKTIKKIADYFHVKTQHQYMTDYWGLIDVEYKGMIIFEYLRPLDLKKYKKFSLNTEKGVVCDINRQELDKFIKDSYELYRSKSDEDYEVKEGKVGDWGEVNRSDKQISPILVFSAYPGKVISLQTPIVYVNKELCEIWKEDKRFNEAGFLKAISEIFIFVDTEESDDDIRQELIGLKKKCKDNISDNDAEHLKINIEVYRSLMKEFYVLLQRYDYRFPSETARKTRGALFSDRMVVFDWINEDIWEILNSIKDLKDEKVIRVLTYLPIKFLSIAVENNDHFVYQNFVNSYRLIYEHATHHEVSKIRELLIGESWKRLEKFNQYYLLMAYRNGKIDNNDLLGYGKYLILEFQELLKISFDKKDIDSFKKFLKTVESLYPGDMYYRELEGYNEVRNDLMEIKSVSHFGLSSWILSKLIKVNNGESMFLSDMFKCLPQDIVELIKIYVQSSDFNTQSDYKWDRWEANEHEDGEVYSGDLSGYSGRLFVICALKILKQMTTERIAKIQLPLQKSFISLAHPDGELRRIIEKMKDEIKADKYKGVLDGQDVQQLDKLDELLQKLTLRHDDRQRELKRCLRVSALKIQEFKSIVKKSFDETEGIRVFLEQYGLIEYKLQVQEQKSSLNLFGINVIHDKGAFLDDVEGLQKVHYLDFGEAFGRSLIQGENRSIGSVVNEKLQDARFSEVDKIIQAFEEPVIIANRLGLYHAFEKKMDIAEYVPKWSDEFKLTKVKMKNVEGLFKSGERRIPVFCIYDFIEEPSVCLVDMKKFGSLIQYTPSDTEDVDKEHIILINIEELTENSERLKNLIEEQPKWLQEHKTKQRQSEYLQESVLIDVYERYEFVVSEGFNGVRLLVEIKEES